MQQVSGTTPARRIRTTECTGGSTRNRSVGLRRPDGPGPLSAQEDLRATGQWDYAGQTDQDH